MKHKKLQGKGARLAATLAGAGLLAGSLVAAGTHPAMAATDSYNAVFQANNNTLYSYGSNGTKTSTTLGMSAGTSPSTTYLSTSTEMSAFQANNNTLYLYKWSGTKTSTTLGMAAGTSPAIIGLATGAAWVVAFQANNGDLYIYDSSGDKTDTGLGMKAGTSPAIAAQPNGSWAVAFQGADGDLHTYGSGGGNSSSGDGMDAASSPSIIPLANGSYEIAFEANTDVLDFFHTGGSTLHTTDGMDAGTSPSIAAQSDGAFVAAFQANTNDVATYNSNGDTAVSSEGMEGGTSPALIPEPDGSYEIAFQANNNTLGVYHTGGSATNTTLGLDPGTSPSFAISPPVAPAAPSGGSTLGEAAANIAIGQVGYIDTPSYSYCNAFTAYWGAGTTVDINGYTCTGSSRAEYWCADFAAWVWAKAGVSFTYGTDLTANSGSFYNYGVAHGTWHAVGSGYTPEAGDAAVYEDSKGFEHVAIVTGGTNADPNVVNGDWGLPPAQEDGVLAQDAETTNGGGAPLVGYASPAS